MGFFSSQARKLSSKPKAASRRDREIEAHGAMLPVRVVEHTRARRLTLRIMPGGRTLKLTVPPYVGEEQIDIFLERNRDWAANHIARMPQAIALGEGASIPYLGVDHRIVHLDRLRGLVEPREIAGEPSLLVPGEPDHVPRKVVDFLKRQARARLNEAVDRHARTLGVRPKSIRITDTKSRWGSCSSTRTLSFSWRIVMAPQEVLDYLAAHEVAHLREMNHSPAFWAHVARLMPDYARHRRWLRTHGNDLHALDFRRMD